MSLYSARVAQDSPVLYFENNASGVNNTGSRTPTITTGGSNVFNSTGGVTNTPYIYVASKTQSSYGFSYTDTASTFDDRIFSITGWFKVASGDIDSSVNHIFHTGTSSNGVFLQNTDKLYVGSFFNGVQVATSTAPAFDVWHYVAVTVDTTNIKLYINGSLVDTASTPASLSMDSATKYWMQRTTSGTTRNGAIGNFDEWAVFNTTLSSTTISEHYALGFAIDYAATPGTASALSVEPTLSVSSDILVDRFNATAELTTGSFGAAVNIPLDARNYLDTLPLEFRFQFEQLDSQNLGDGGFVRWRLPPGETNIFAEKQTGLQLSSALKLTGSTADGELVSFSSNLLGIINDDDWSLGFFIKTPSILTDTNPIPLSIGNYSGQYVVLNYIADNYLLLDVNFGESGSQYIQFNSPLIANQWNLVVIEKNGSDIITYLNGIEDDVTAITDTQPTDFAQIRLNANITDPIAQYMYMSELFVSTPTTITPAVITALHNASEVPVNASGLMNDAKVSFNNRYNILVESYNPIVDIRFDSNDEPYSNSAQNGEQLLTEDTSAVTNGVLTKNTRGVKFNDNFGTYITQFNTDPGTFSGGTQTLSLYAKLDADKEPVTDEVLVSAGLYGDVNGCGLTLLNGGNGEIAIYLLSFALDPFPLEERFDSGLNLNDGLWHHYVATFDDDQIKLYIDGSLVMTETTAFVLSDTVDFTVGSQNYWFGGADAEKEVGLTVDEAQLFSQVFTAQQVLELYQAIGIDRFEASALMSDPAVAGGFGPTIAEPPMLASAELPKVFPFIKVATAFATFNDPNYEAIDNTSNAAEPMTASAQGEDPVWSVGESNGVLHMSADASFPDARVLIPGFWNANPFIANPAEMVEPAISSTLGALINAQQMPAKAIFVSPPAYKLITDDIWYQKLFLQHSVVHNETGNTSGVSSAYAFLKLFDDVTSNLPGAVTSKLTNNLPWSIVTDNPDATATTVTYATASNEFLTATPEPLLEVGTYDDYERKSVRFRNTQFKVAEDVFKAEGPYSLEFTFKSTKSNQVIAQSLQRSFIGSQSATGSIGLVDGKLFATRVTQEIGGSRIFAHPDNTNLVSTPSRISTAYGNKRIDDGAWHHIIVQHGFDGRVQFWIDGELDIQFFGDSIYGRGGRLRPYIFGSNHTNSRWQSDFETSAWSYDAAFFVESDQIIEHYTASIKYEPVAAEVATASAEMPEPVVAGNRPRALMLYFWPTSTGQATNLSYANFTSTESPTELETIDYYTAPPQQYQGWDVFPVDVTGRYVSDLVKPEAYGIENIQLTTLGGTVDIFAAPQQTLKINKRRTFRDALTDAPRYIDLINDIDLSKFDMIMFKNYPNDPAEKDSFTGTEVVDEYFNLRESAIFEEFVKSLRAAVDTGLSLMVANAQLALDLKIVDRVETVPDMDDNFGQGDYSDTYSPTQMFGVPEAEDLPTPPQYKEPLGWQDSWKNNRTRIVNTYSGITDYESLIKTQQAFWQSTDELRWGGPDRPFARYENKNSLSVGDEFVISTTGKNGDNNRQGYLATPFENVKAGKVITAFANTLRRGLDEIENPYKNYAQSIILEPGDVLDGRQVGGKIYVNFTEEINKCEESGPLELISDFWVNYAYDNGIIPLELKDELLAAEYNQDTTPYWSLNGMNLLQQTGSEFVLDTDVGRRGLQKEEVKLRKVNKDGGISFKQIAPGSVFFSSTYSWRYPMASVEIPSMPTRGFRWLSNREVLEGTVIRPEAFTAIAEMPNALGIPDRETDFNAQAMVATALIEETQFSSGERKVNSLPMIATATIVKPGSTIGVEPMVANVGMFANSRSNVASEDQVTVYLIHVDPILYIREDVIK
jgi:hypothetical protein